MNLDIGTTGFRGAMCDVGSSKSSYKQMQANRESRLRRRKLNDKISCKGGGDDSV